jgi:anti-sigma regulatory factor (Ser/Thr protein kinase)
MPYYACPNCGSSVSSAGESAPGACPGCCARLHVTDDVPLALAAVSRHARRPPAVVKMAIDDDDSAPAAARGAIRDLSGDLGDARMHVCELLVSELVTNVVRHAPPRSVLTAADLRVRMYADRVRVEVRDDGPGFSPHTQPIDPEAESGWGLRIVREFADEWGVELGAQNCVWFEVGRTPVASG